MNVKFVSLRIFLYDYFVYICETIHHVRSTLTGEALTTRSCTPSNPDTVQSRTSTLYTLEPQGCRPLKSSSLF
jgi:hypothetical protein